MKKDRAYFPHDYHARTDEKIIPLFQKMGWEGYGIYWGIVEKIYESGGELKPDYDCIAFDMRISCDRIKIVIENFDLFYFSDSGGIRNKRVDNEILQREKISEAGKIGAKSRWEKCERNAEAMRPHPNRNARIGEDKIREDNISGGIVKGGGTATPRAAVFVLPDWIPGELWTAYEEQRRKQRRALTNSARQFNLRSLDKLRTAGEDVQAIMERTIERGWQGFFSLYGDNSKPLAPKKPKPINKFMEDFAKVKKECAEEKAGKTEAELRAELDKFNVMKNGSLKYAQK